MALIIAPTRELAAQIAGELTWLFAPLSVRITAVMGGVSFGLERRALSAGPLIVVGTPGRLVDHLTRGTLTADSLGVVVLDEADQMLDLGFRDELETILDRTPSSRQTLLVSATFAPNVLALAKRYQRDAFMVEGAKSGESNLDIAHVAHLVKTDERLAALRNILLLAPSERALVFVRTRDAATDVAQQLSDSGLAASSIRGDLDQRDRTRVLEAFRSGTVKTLVATDVAARGIDVPDVARVIHLDPPMDPESLIHRSGRTGRAGRKGTSVMFVAPNAYRHAVRLFRAARIEPSFQPPPSPSDVHAAADARLSLDLKESPRVNDERARALAQTLLATMDPTDLVAALLTRGPHLGPCAPSPVTIVPPPPPNDLPARRLGPNALAARMAHAPYRPLPSGEPREASSGYVPFRINWGERQGADARRLLAMLCRRGNVRGDEIGAIRVGTTFSTFEVKTPVAKDFEKSSRLPDKRDPHIRIALVDGPPQRPVRTPSREPIPARSDAIAGNQA